LNTTHFNRTIIRFGLTLVLLLSVTLLALSTVRATGRPQLLPVGDWEHLIITSDELAKSFIPLRDQRDSQGLTSRIVTLEEIAVWSSPLANQREAIREFLTSAQTEWNTRYVLLGGDESVIRAPLSKYVYGGDQAYIFPVDIYYVCPDGEWDVDEDGYLGEPQDDLPDLISSAVIGRVPVTDIQQVAAFVAKTIAFETAVPEAPEGVLLAGTVVAPYPWFPGDPVHLDGAEILEQLAELVTAADPDRPIGRLYQNPAAHPAAEPLNPDTLVETLLTGDYRWLAFTGHGEAETWELSTALYLHAEGVAPLADSPRPAFVEALCWGPADYLADGIMERMVMLPTGGCAGALGSSGITFIAPYGMFRNLFWAQTVNGEGARWGDAILAARLAYIDQYGQDGFGALTLMTVTLLGDPALLIDAATARQPVRQPVVLLSDAQASPNPFNPNTTVSFSVGDGSRLIPVSLKIYDLAGRLVTTLLDGDLRAGRVSIVWQGTDDNGSSVGSGMYLAQIYTPTEATNLKLILVE